MRPSRYLVLLASTFLVSIFGFCGEAGHSPGNVLRLEKFEAGPMLGEDVLRYRIEEAVTPAALVDGPHVRMGKAAEWMINNTVKPNGWSFTGWSKTGLDEDFRPWRIHVGIVSGELDANVAQSLSDKSRWTPRHDLLEEWERRRNNEVVFGIVFTKHF